LSANLLRYSSLLFGKHIFINVVAWQGSSFNTLHVEFVLYFMSTSTYFEMGGFFYIHVMFVNTFASKTCIDYCVEVDFVLHDMETTSQNKIEHHY